MPTLNIPLYFAVLFVLGIGMLVITALFAKIPYKRRGLMTPKEHRFYKLLKPFIEMHFDFFAQVRLASIVNIDKKSIQWRWFKALGAKTVDFVICDRETGYVLLVIELDGKSRFLWWRTKKDRFVSKVLNSAGIPVLHVKIRNHYHTKRILGRIREKIENIPQTK